ncbi:hypothetical protein Syun_023856 [Stephania yunnanensis]|uniref:DUF4283 domain-containing protein n=1 Tax=Stephania yunnanensis TaxID=152371 RepID=A0AAP0F9P6_9MAGN
MIEEGVKWRPELHRQNPKLTIHNVWITIEGLPFNLWNEWVFQEIGRRERCYIYQGGAPGKVGQLPLPSATAHQPKGKQVVHTICTKKVEGSDPYAIDSSIARGDDGALFATSLATDLTVAKEGTRSTFKSGLNQTTYKSGLTQLTIQQVLEHVERDRAQLASTGGLSELKVVFAPNIPVTVSIGLHSQLTIKAATRVCAKETAPPPKQILGSVPLRPVEPTSAEDRGKLGSPPRFVNVVIRSTDEPQANEVCVLQGRSDGAAQEGCIEVNACNNQSRDGSDGLVQPEEEDFSQNENPTKPDMNGMGFDFNEVIEYTLEERILEISAEASPIRDRTSLTVVKTRLRTLLFLCKQEQSRACPQLDSRRA